MKKRFVTLGLVMTMAVGVLSGCGSSGSNGKTMTVSEMLETVMEDNDGEVYLYEVESGGDNKDKPFGKDMKVTIVIIFHKKAYNSPYPIRILFWNPMRQLQLSSAWMDLFILRSAA